MPQSTPNRPTTRALIGTMALVVLLLAYVFVAMLAALLLLPHANRFVEFLYYAIAGIAWVPLAAVVLKWMYAVRAPRPGPH